MPAFTARLESGILGWSAQPHGGGGSLDFEKSWAETLAKAATGEPGTIKGRLYSEDKSQRYKQLSDLIEGIDERHALPRLAIDGWLNRIDAKNQFLPSSKAHDLKWHHSADVQIGAYELHLGLHK
ncbi:MAG TPA: hypothetical protein VMT54_09265 [Candidatus Cybelea sp.]|nr:hypothetical protein [Candidatus Cybelea sp.]